MCRKVLKEFFLGWEYATDKKNITFSLLNTLISFQLSD